MSNRVHFQKLQGADLQWYWRLRAANNKIIAQGEGYTREADVDRAINMIREFGLQLKGAPIQPASSRLRAASKSVQADAIQDGWGLLYLVSAVFGKKAVPVPSLPAAAKTKKTKASKKRKAR